MLAIMVHGRVRLSRQALVVLLGSVAILASAQQPKAPISRQFPRFTLSPGQLDPDGLPTSGAKLCVSNVARICYQMPQEHAPASGKVIYEFGLDPRSERLPVPGGGSWVFFASTFSGGGSGTLERITVLRYEEAARGGRIVNLLPYVAVTNQSDRAMWEVPGASAYPILVLADFVWRTGEAHFSRHSYRVEAWTFDSREDRYKMALSYRTDSRYKGLDEAGSVHVLVAERNSILRRRKHQ